MAVSFDEFQIFLPVLVEMIPGLAFVGRVRPLNLFQPCPSALEMRNVEGSRVVMMGKVSHLLPIPRDLDDGKGGVWKGVDVCPVPLLCLGRRNNEEQ
jgi:hypothetical protein